jgi:hypothetical protein
MKGALAGIPVAEKETWQSLRSRNLRARREEVPHGRETLSLGPRKDRKKVQPLDGEAAIDRQYEPGAERAQDNPWQDPGGPEPANG